MVQLTQMSVEPLRRKAVRAGVHLTLRRVAGLGLSFFGTLILTRILGPEAYGAYAAAMATLGYFLAVGQQGGRVYLIRLPENAPEQTFSTMFWWLFAFSFVNASLLSLIGLLLHWQGNSVGQFSFVLMTIAFTLVFGNLRGVFAARLERDFEYDKLAFIELGGQAMSYAVAIPVALKGGGVTALILGLWSAELLQIAMLALLTRFRPRWVWDRAQIRDIIQESLKMSAGAWAYELRQFTVPLILLPLAGERGVGYYALAQRLVSSMTMVSDAVAQLSVPLYARLQNQPPELLRAIYRSAQAQLLGFGVIATVAVVAGYPILSLIYRTKWDVDILTLTIVTLCLHTMLFVIFGAQAQALYVIRRTEVMLKLSVLATIYIFIFTFILTYATPETYRPIGYVLGIFWAHQLIHWQLHRAVERYLARPYYRMNLVWAIAIGVALFSPFTNYWTLLGLTVFLHPASLREIRDIIQLLRSSRASSGNPDKNARETA